MKTAKKIKAKAKVNLQLMVDQLARDIETTRNIFSDVVIMDGSPAQIYSHLSALKGGLDEMNEKALVIQEELHERK